MCFKNFLLHKLICIVYLLKYLNNNVTIAFYMFNFLKNDGKMFKYYKRLDDVLMFKKQSLP
jgi:hypothetical protein